IIVLNAGSSSLKFSIFAIVDNKLSVRARGQIEGLGTTPRFKARDHRGQPLADSVVDGSTKSFGHHEAFAYLADWMRSNFRGELNPLAVGHRMAHGGMDFVEPILIDADVLARLEKLIPLVPLHQPHNIAAIKAVTALRPDLQQVACFDTAFHRGRAGVTERFGLPDELFRLGLRRWGFHGLSYDSISRQFRQIAPETAAGRVIVAHLGSGASLCAMKGGRSVDTTMGFSALDGVPMGTRCGSLDPGVILFLLHQGWNAQRIEELLYKKSGLIGVSSVSNDVRELQKSDQPLASEAIEFFVYRVAREIGSLAAALGGLDALIFTAGIGENSPVIREKICRQCEWLGVSIEAEANLHNKQRISAPGKTPSVWVIPTDEEGVIAAQTHRLLSALAEQAQITEKTLIS
ncbi:MAG TPA: acetate/propionate family kinase, partial [Phycisphaerae bacterium]|nr:acetate/propionate family kinase [Phycisphaerae bacterium]